MIVRDMIIGIVSVSYLFCDESGNINLSRRKAAKVLYR